MAEKSNSAEALLKKASDLLAMKIAARVLKLADEAGDDLDSVRMIDALARAGRAIAAMQVATVKAIHALRSLEADPEDKESPMNDDASGDGLDEVHAEIDRRLAAFARSLEHKRVEASGDKAGQGRPAGQLGALEPPAPKAA